MAEGPDNLVLEQLRQFRSEMAALRTEMNQGFATLNQRLDRMETESRGVNYVATVSIGSILGQIDELKARLSRLEKA